MNKSEFLSILSIHRGRIKSSIEKPGWNKWALYGTLATVTWIIIDYYEKQKLEFHNSIILLNIIIAISLIFNSLKSFFSERSISRDTYVYISKTYASIKIVMFFLSIFILGLIYFMNTEFQLITWTKYFLNAFYSFLFLFTICVLIFTFYEIPIQDKKNSYPDKIKNEKTQQFLSLVLLITTIYSLYINIDNFSVNILKSSLLFFSLLFVIYKIIESLPENPLLKSIDRLIDDVTFDIVDIKKGHENLKIILIGYEFKDIIAPIIEDYLFLNKEWKNTSKELVNIVETSSEEEIEIVKPRIKQLFDRLETLNKKLQKFNKNIESKLNYHCNEEEDNSHYWEVTDLINSGIEENKLFLEKIKTAYNTV